MPQRRGALPVSDAEVLGSSATYARGVPFDRLERLRSKTPVVWLDGRLDGGAGAWAVLRYADVRRALSHPELFVSEPDGVFHGPLTPAGHFPGSDDERASAERPDGGDRGDRGEDGDAADGGDGDDGDMALLDMDPPARAMLDRVPRDATVDFVTEVTAELPETVRNTLAGGLYALLRHPAQHERLLAAPGDDRLLDSAVEEMLRWWTPVTQVARTVRRSTVMGGVPLRAGERVALWLASANHDGEAFPDPDSFQAGRFLTSARPHLGFGFGTRACVGARLARVHLRALLVAILERPGRPRLTGEPVMLRSSARRGFERLPVRWTG
ncbi:MULTISPECIES: cytochrome P450 [Actinomadura]|uniref:Cytochrome P450 n=1 Tax=Actinomadura yumaensis TaxID=111807 RepID=A0ABW2CQL4_9ACTN|nr:cytochrome P450 [Actinomadura sp. J1-007]MWK36275.1 cytochrome P450 [Actinomadura sp. J1-007]